MIAPDETTFAWVEGARRAAIESPRRGATLRTDDGATFDREIVVDAAARQPAGHLGHDPGMVVAVTDAVPEPQDRRRRARAGVHGPRARHADRGDHARPRLHRLVHEQPHRRPARRRRGRQGPQGRRRRPRDGRAGLRSRSRRRPRREGLDEVFREAGFDWRDAGCSMCLGMNPDIARARRALRLDLEPQLRGPPGPRRAHATSSRPQMAAAAAIEGHFVDIREWS